MLALIADWNNLLLAYRKASRGKRGHADVAGFEHRLEDNLFKLRGDLLTRRYRPGAYQSFYVHDPKRRLISAAPFRDREVHHALCNLIESLFERSFVADSYANRVGKGTHRAIDRAQRLARRHRYVLQADVRQFFPSIDHAILRDTIARAVDDADVLRLVDLILASGVDVLADEYNMVYFPGDDLFAANRPRGLPIGNLTSQFWANVYLNPLDHFVKRELRCPGYVRYVDDLLLFGDDKAELWAWKMALKRRLAARRLTIHPGAHPRPVTEGIPFLGFVVFPDRRRLKRRNAVRYRRRVRGLVAQWRSGVLCAESVADSLRGWENHVCYGNTVALRNALRKELPRDILALLHSDA